MRRYAGRFALVSLVALAILGGRAPANAAEFPDRSIRVIVPFAGAGTTDIVSRILFERVGQLLGQTIIIDNRPGAGGNIGLDLAAKSPPDGYTLVVDDPSVSLAALPALYPTLGLDPVKDLSPIALFGTTGAVLLVTKSLPARTLAQFVALAKSEPGQLTYGSTGIGTPGHLNAALFSWLVGIKTLHVPYRNGGQGTTDLLAGRISFWIAPIPTRLEQIKAGDLRALAVSGTQRSPDLPDIPTVKESGFGDFEASTDYAVFAPSGTPAAIVAKLHGAIQSAVEDDTVKQKLRAAGVEPLLKGPADVSEILKSQIARWTAVIADADIKADSH
jgi:tripartite-type tricarboxylate transporter receptor subunit TctC